ncbi:MAG: transaldolase [Stackebrandtia sp.]
MSRDRLAELSAAGVAVWLDDISRQRLTSQGPTGLRALRDDKHVVGVTSNPTWFAKALQSVDDYSEQLTDLALREVSVDEATRAVTAADVRAACDAMRQVYDATDGIDGRVSLEVDPRLAYDADRTLAEAKALWWMVDRPNLFIKIPATAESLPAIADSLAAGISVNVTLIFGLQRYREVMDAFFTGLERARAAGRDLSKLGSVASFFVSRVDAEVDKRLDKIGSPAAAALRGKAAVANARLAHQAYVETFDSDRWKALAEAGARSQRPLWASTGVKDPDYRDVKYVEELVVPGVVNTMPEGTLNAYADHGETVEDSVTGDYDDARRVLQDLAGLGVDYDDVVAVLEREGVEKFTASWNELLTSVRTAVEKSK